MTGAEIREDSLSAELWPRQLEALRRLAMAWPDAESLEQLYDEALQTIRVTLNVPRAALLLIDEDGVARFKAWHGLSEHYRQMVEGHFPWPVDARGAQPILVPDVTADPDLEPLHDVLAAEGIAAVAFVPLEGAGHLLGKCMLYHDTPHAFCDSEVRLATAVVGYVSWALERRRSEEALRQSQEQLGFALEAASLGTWHWDLVSGRVRWSEELERIHGLDPGTFEGTFDAFQADMHPDDLETVLTAIQATLVDRLPYHVQYRIRRRDGAVRWMEARGRVHADQDRPVAVVGVCTDVTARRRHDEGLALLAEASEALFTSLNQQEVLDRVGRLLVPRLCQWATVHLKDDHERLSLAALSCADPDTEAALMRSIGSIAPVRSRIAEVVRTGWAQLYDGVRDDLLVEMKDDEVSVGHLRALSLRAGMLLPLRVRGTTLGGLTVATTELGHVYDESDLALANELAYRIALALDNARLFEQKATAARALQRSLVPELAQVPGVAVAARYLPAEGDIGGDFYDFFPSGRAGQWVVAMGDVSGKGVAAAALSAMVRHSLHALGRSGPNPAALLRALHASVMPEFPEERFCTVACATLEIHDGQAHLRIASAGHPLPLVLRATGELDTFGRPGTLLGTIDTIDVAEETTELRPGDTVVLYTDGALWDRPGDDPPGDATLRQALVATAGRPVQEIAERLEQAVRRPSSPADDTAILVLQIPR